jgi:nicotinamide-nucleotide amidase
MTINNLNDLEHLAGCLGDVLMAKGLYLVTAESCTGGWLASMITSVAGSSAWFERGMVTYSNQSKTDLLGVPGALIAEHGAVSSAVVVAMAEGARQSFAGEGSSVAVAITGIAGPTGGSLEKPVGTVWFSWARAGDVRSECKYFPGDRNKVRYLAVHYALEGCLKYWS